MFSKTMTNRMKAAAIAALMCLSAAAAAVPVMTDSMMVSAVSIGETLEVKDEYRIVTADIGTDLDAVTLTLEADYTGNFSYGLGISIAEDPWWMEWDGSDWVDTEGGTVEVPGISVPVTAGEQFTIVVDTSSLKLKYDPAGSEWGAGEIAFRNYYSGTGGSVTLVSATAGDNGTTTPSEDEDDTPGTSSDRLEVDDVYLGYTADLASSGIKTITFTVEADYTGNFTYGFGIGTAEDPYWEEVAEDEVAVTEGKEVKITVDVSKLKLSYNPSSDQYPGKFEFRNYYSPDGSGVTVKKVEANSSSASTPTDPDSGDSNVGENGGKTDGSTTSNKKSGSWSFVDNGDGTGTMTATQARQLDGLDFLLTKGYDEDYYAELGETPGEDDPINSHKFMYADFGLGAVGSVKTDSGITIESIEATITSEIPVKRFMYGGGLNVGNATPADTESAKVAAGIKEDGGYWYNDMGTDKYDECVAAGAEFGVEVGRGYDVSSETMQLGEYFNVIWDVPADVMPYEDSGSISFQFWYGEQDVEEYTELETCNLVGAVLTYTEEKTFDYTDTASIEVGEAIAAGDMSTGVKYTDMGLGENSSVKAVVFTLDAGADLDKLVYAVGTSVGESWQLWSDKENGDAWDYVVTDTESGTVEICWIVPEGVDVNEMYGNVQFGYWYGGKGEEVLDEVTLESIDVYYYEEEPETTEPPTEETTETTEEDLKATLYGDVNVDGKVSIADVLTLNKNLMCGDKLTEIGALNADVDLDGKPSSSDALNILKYTIMIVEKLPV